MDPFATRRLLPVLILIAAFTACTFRPDYSNYDKCDDQNDCEDPKKECFVEEKICITLCGESDPCPPDEEDAGNDDAGAPDAGPKDAGAQDAGDAGENDAGEPDGGLFLDPTLPPAIELKPYQHTFDVSGGTEPYTFQLTGTLPAGVVFTLNPPGTLSGTPDDAGTFAFKVTATDDSAPPASVGHDYILQVVPQLRVASPAQLPNSDGKAYVEPLLHTGGSGASPTWTVIAGALPSNLTIDGGTLSSTGPVSGAASFTLRATDPGLANQTADRAFSIAAGGGLTFYLATRNLPDGRVGTPYSYTLKAGAGTTPYAWSLPSGSVLPPGLSLVGGGVVSGTPITRGTYSFSIDVTDDSIVPSSATLNASVTIY